MKLDRAYTNGDYWRYAFGIGYRTFGKSWVIDIVLASFWIGVALLWRDSWWMVSLATVCAVYRVFQAISGYRREWK